jgi:hypothetical protein
MIKAEKKKEEHKNTIEAKHKRKDNCIVSLYSIVIKV